MNHGKSHNKKGVLLLFIFLFFKLGIVQVFGHSCTHHHVHHFGFQQQHEEEHQDKNGCEDCLFIFDLQKKQCFDDFVLSLHIEENVINHDSELLIFPYQKPFFKTITQSYFLNKPPPFHS